MWLILLYENIFRRTEISDLKKEKKNSNVQHLVYFRKIVTTGLTQTLGNQLGLILSEGWESSPSPQLPLPPILLTFITWYARAQTRQTQGSPPEHPPERQHRSQSAPRRSRSCSEERWKKTTGDCGWKGKKERKNKTTTAVSTTTLTLNLGYITNCFSGYPEGKCAGHIEWPSSETSGGSCLDDLVRLTARPLVTGYSGGPAGRRRCVRSAEKRGFVFCLDSLPRPAIVLIRSITAVGSNPIRGQRLGQCHCQAEPAGGWDWLAMKSLVLERVFIPRDRACAWVCAYIRV